MGSTVSRRCQELHARDIVNDVDSIANEPGLTPSTAFLIAVNRDQERR
jgi:hypothetical protein